MGLPLGATLLRLHSTLWGEESCIDHAFVRGNQVCGRAGKGRGCSKQSAQMAIWTGGWNTALAALPTLSRSLCIRVHGQATPALC
eukprot:1161220-Pelagomonas_calceolata.AAC.23